jgi:hypothetical protein
LSTASEKLIQLQKLFTLDPTNADLQSPKCTERADLMVAKQRSRARLQIVPNRSLQLETAFH